MNIWGNELNDTYIVRKFFAGKLAGPDTPYKLPFDPPSRKYWQPCRTVQLTERKACSLRAFYNSDGTLRQRLLKDVAQELGVTSPRARGLQNEALFVLGIRFLKLCRVL